MAESDEKKYDPAQTAQDVLAEMKTWFGLAPPKPRTTPAVSTGVLLPQGSPLKRGQPLTSPFLEDVSTVKKKGEELVGRAATGVGNFIGDIAERTAKTFGVGGSMILEGANKAGGYFLGAESPTVNRIVAENVRGFGAPATSVINKPGVVPVPQRPMVTPTPAQVPTVSGRPVVVNRPTILAPNYPGEMPPLVGGVEGMGRPVETTAPVIAPTDFWSNPANNPNLVDVLEGGRWTNKAEWHGTGGIGVERGLAQENLRIALKRGDIAGAEKAAKAIHDIELGLGERIKAPPEAAEKTATAREKTAKAKITEAELPYAGLKSKAEIAELNARATAHGVPAKKLKWEIEQANTQGIFTDPLKAAKWLGELGQETVTTINPDTEEKTVSKRPNFRKGVEAMKNMGLGHLLPKEILTAPPPKEEMTELPVASLHKDRVIVRSDGVKLKSDGKTWNPVK